MQFRNGSRLFASPGVASRYDGLGICAMEDNNNNKKFYLILDAFAHARPVSNGYNYTLLWLILLTMNRIVIEKLYIQRILKISRYFQCT